MTGGRRRAIGSLLVATLALVAGCQHSTGPTNGQQIAPIVRHAQAQLRVKTGAYVLPQDEGRLQIACPVGWDWATAPRDYVLGFHRKNHTLDELPRILIAAEDSPFPGRQEVGEATLIGFAQEILTALGERPRKTPVTPLVVGDRACVAYVEVPSGSKAPRLVVKTVAGGRLYTINLDVAEPQFDKYRDAAYAVAASLKSLSAAASPESLPSTEPSIPEARPEAAAQK